MFKSLNDRCFIVGGAIRDEILGIEPKDFDYVIENCSLEEFLSVFPDAKRVGTKETSPPVFLINNCEVALCRKEISYGTGYSDFDFEVGVSIEEDLARRDISINSLAKKYMTGEIVDPYNGIEDIKNKIIRCLNPQNLKDDPLRILRIIRFALRFQFSIESKTFNMMKEYSHYLRYVQYERIELELRKVYNECEKPSEFFRLLDSIDGMHLHFEELVMAKGILAGPIEHHNGKTVFDHSLDAFDNAKRKGHTFSEGIASLFHDISKILSPISDPQHHYGHENKHNDLMRSFFLRHRFDKQTMELSLVVGRWHMYIHLFTKIKKVVKLIRFYRYVKRYHDSFIKCCDNDHSLTNEQLKIFEILRMTFEKTVIILPGNIDKKNKQKVIEFVEKCYVNKFIELSKII